VLITGATGGLGRSLALQLADRSCQVTTLVLSGRNSASLRTVAEECRTKNQNEGSLSDGTAIASILVVHTLVCDLADPQSVSQLCNDVLSLKTDRPDNGVDVLINCGGVSSRSRFVDTSLEVDRKIMQINFFAGAALAKAFVLGMITRGTTQPQQQQHIIWISSVQGLVGIPNRSSYAASKFAVQGYCESVRAELASSNVRVHTVSPGYIRTNLSNSAITGDGTSYGKTDATTQAGADPDELAVEILNRCFANGEVDFVVAATPSAKAAIWLRLLCPGVLRKILVKRYEKSLAVEKEKEE